VRRLLNRFPEGTTAIGVGLLIGGLAAYAFITISSRDLGAEQYSPVAMLWALSFMLGPGFFLPLEQETARVVARRGSQGLGSAPVVRMAAIMGLGVALLLALTSILAAPWAIDAIFDGNALLFIGLLVVVFGLGASHLAKGVLAGLGRFPAYGRYLVGEGGGRLLLVLAVIFLSDSVGPYGLAIGLAPFVGLLVALAGQKELLEPGPPAHLGDLSRALGSLMAASVAMAFLINVSPLAVELLADDTQAGESGRFLNALLIARIPLFFFQAIQASLLPELSRLAGIGDHGELWRVLRRLLRLLTTLSLVTVVAAAFLGPLAVEVAFGSGFAVDARDMVLLTASSGLLMIAGSLAQALIACQSQGSVAVSWVVGVAVFPLAILVGDDLFFRVEFGLLAAVACSAVTMGFQFRRRLRQLGVRDWSGAAT
jgi:O-antigen/teichoic acid export membrane protein